MAKSIELDFEIKRKLFHLSSLVVPFFYLLLSQLVMLPRLTMIIVLVIVTAVILYVDISRHYNLKVKDAVDNIFSVIMRQRELSGTFALSGMSYFFMGTLLVVALFPRGLAITAMLVLILADTVAALVGMKYGEKLKNGKSWMGSVAFMSVSVLVSILCYFTIGYATTFLVILLSSAFTTAAEFYACSWRVNDNILIPLIYAFSTFILSFIL